MSMKRAISVTIDISQAEAAMIGIDYLADSNRARKVLTECLAEACDSSMLGEMHGRAGGLGAMHSRAAGGLTYNRSTDGVKITAGGVPWVAGSEFGGQVKVATYITRSRLGNSYAVTRHTTRQFNPWRGQRGYWMWPVITERLQGIREKLINAFLDQAA